MVTDSTPRRSLWAFDRSDRWGLTVLLAAVTIGVAVGRVVVPAVGWARGDAVPVAVSGPVSVPALDTAGASYGPGQYDVAVTGVAGWQRLLDLLPGVALAVLVVACCVLVLLVMRDIAAGDPFRARSVTRLRALAALVAVGFPALWFVEVPVDLALLTEAELGAGAPSVLLALPWLPVLVGSVIALLAEAFAAGSRLRDDVEGLV